MTRRWQILTSLLLSTFVPASTISIYAQEKQPAREQQSIQRVRTASADDSQTPPRDNFFFVASEMNSDGKLVKGAPYSAQAVTETTQTLSDGNRIVNKSTATLYRDSEGRTRREQTLRVMGPLAATGEAPQTIFINDPVAGVNYALDTRERVAHKMPPMRFEFKLRSSGDGKGEGIGIGSGGGVAVGTGAGVGIGSSTQVTAAPQVFERVGPPPEGVRVMGPAGSQGMGPGMVFERTMPAPGSADSGGMVFQWTRGRNENLKTEALGKQSIEGVEAEGTRNTLEIPAGEVGNERPIEIVFERWYSPELQMVVMTRHADPRFGETTYRLTNINRSEPAHELFEVPADYTLQEPPTMPVGAPMKGIFGGVMNGKAITLPLPEYPAVARQAKVSGSVTVEVSIDESGNVVSAHSVSGHPLLQAAAVTAARQAKFSPTKLSGQPTKVNGVLVYTFTAQ